ncbi:MAG: winged helix-turn-helix transcriptional regulator [Armatimonadetes bacterium]|nr:winged helix-turn-helix transcriptional regulator [Armatimonadota bacterium]MDW8121622.1 winged helix-turn-helix transcriptional regulator [Armatimonadota bacterium]
MRDITAGSIRHQTVSDFPISKVPRWLTPPVDEVLRCKWSVLVLALLGEGKRRPSQILKSCPGLTAKVLGERLKKLQILGLVQREPSDGFPKKTIYRLTPHGRRAAQWASLLISSGLTYDQWTQILGCRHTARVLSFLAHQSCRPKVLRYQLRMSDKVLFDRLKKLEQMGLVVRRVLAARPLQVFYALSPKAQNVLALLRL